MTQVEPLRFGSLCSGIEAASVAWECLGWKAAWFSEIDPFPNAVLEHHFPDVPNHGDMQSLPGRILNHEVEAPELICGGTPCQAFSVAGLRKSLDDDRGNLSLTYCEIIDACDEVRQKQGLLPTIAFWENVPGVLSTKDNAFGCFLARLIGADAPLCPPQAAAGVQLVMLLDRKDKRRGESLMLNISESPNDVAVSLLSQVLEKDSIPAKYYLSARACRGILLRAQKWDYKLPPRLEKACHWMIAHESLTSPTSGDSTTKTK